MSPATVFHLTLWANQPQPVQYDTAFYVFVCIPLAAAGCYLVLTGYSSVLDSKEALANARGWLLKKRIEWVLARHGLSNDQVVDALMAMDEFTYHVGDGEDAEIWTCRRGPDGQHEFIRRFPPPEQSLAEASSDQPSQTPAQEQPCASSASS